MQLHFYKFTFLQLYLCNLKQNPGKRPSRLSLGFAGDCQGVVADGLFPLLVEVVSGVSASSSSLCTFISIFCLHVCLLWSLDAATVTGTVYKAGSESLLLQFRTLIKAAFLSDALEVTGVDPHV